MSTDEIATLKPMDTPKPKEKPLTRQQRRLRERIETEANDTYQQITKKFFTFFVTHDNPQGQEVQDRIEQVDIQWRMYCRKMNLIKDVHGMFEKHANGLLDEYVNTKAVKDEA